MIAAPVPAAIASQARDKFGKAYGLSLVHILDIFYRDTGSVTLVFRPFVILSTHRKRNVPLTTFLYESLLALWILTCGQPPCRCQSSTRGVTVQLMYSPGVDSRVPPQPALQGGPASKMAEFECLVGLRIVVMEVDPLLPHEVLAESFAKEMISSIEATISKSYEPNCCLLVKLFKCQ